MGSERIKLAVNPAVVVYNDGEVKLSDVLGKLGMESGQNYVRYLLQKDERRVSKSCKKASELEKKKRQSVRVQQKEREERAIEREGNQYESGHF